MRYEGCWGNIPGYLGYCPEGQHFSWPRWTVDLTVWLHVTPCLARQDKKWINCLAQWYVLFPSCLAHEYCTIQQPTLICHTKGCLLSKQLSTLLFILSHHLVFKLKCQSSLWNTPSSVKPREVGLGRMALPVKLPCPARELEPVAGVLQGMVAGQPSAHSCPCLSLNSLSL